MAATVCAEGFVTADINTPSNKEILFNSVSNEKLSSLIQELNSVLFYYFYFIFLANAFSLM